MTRTVKLVSLCAAVAAGVSLVALAQPAADKKPQPAKEGAPPAGMPDMEKMMEAWAKAATPGDMHKWLMESVGTWEGKTKMWMDPSMPAEESTCTTTITSMFGGRYTKGETKGNMTGPDGKPMLFEGFGLYGFDNTTNQFQCTWCDNMGTMMLNFTGTLSADKKTLTLTAHFVDCMTGQKSWMREVETRKSPTSMTLEMFAPTMDGKGEFKMMQIDYTKK
ncbi:hypothetical protein PHYC_01542 [Phycisphaerales bacterium]|nr:hypothetical protein PHYC_01542 [Phycisphaerales bacterium]